VRFQNEWLKRGLIAALLTSTALPAYAQDAAQRADAQLATMSLQDQMSLVFSRFGGGFGGDAIPAGALGSAAFLQPTPHHGLPTLEITDAGLGVGDPRHLRPDGLVVSLPSGLATASTWDVDMARKGGTMIGNEAWRTGFNVLLAGGADLTRDPRNGRNFEYAGEDPVLTGRIVGNTIAGVQSQHVITTIKHFAMNDLETSRMTMSANIAPAAMRESDLLGFEIAIETGHPGSVMCSYNRVNDLYACENAYLLTKTLKQDWKFPGFVMSDWGADHTTARAALAGLDQESSGDTIDSRPFFGKALADAVQKGAVPKERVSDMARRVMYAIYDAGLSEHPPVIQPVDFAADKAVAERDEEEGIVLLKNTHDLLPLHPDARVLVVGGHADAGVLSGGGSSQVNPPGGNAVPLKDKNLPWPGAPVYFPSAPFKAMQALAPGRVTYDPGTDLRKATTAAHRADAVVVFATKWSFESADSPDVSLPDQQDVLIAALAKANPHVIVVLETGNPVLMPWLPNVQVVLEAWYPGSDGGTAIARVLYGAVTPSGHLPMSFPQSAAQLPRPEIPGVKADTVFDVQFHTDQEVMYDEGSEVGYRWYDHTHQQPLFPFGFGLSYSQFQFDDLHTMTTAQGVSASFTVHNTGKREGAAVPQIYVTLPDGGGRRLAGWARVTLAPGTSQTVTVPLEPRVFARFDETAGNWRIPAGDFVVRLASDAQSSGLTQTLKLDSTTIKP